MSSRAALVVIALALTPVALAGGRSPTGVAVCGSATSGGATVITWCGPARATVSFGGKTYRVTGGKCLVTNAAGIVAWTANIGRQTLPPAKPKYPDFHALTIGKPKAGTFVKSEYEVNFAVPGASWSIAQGLPHKVTVNAGARSGTFTGRFFTTSGSPRKASGSWRC